jgi:hypothetical protein
LCSRARRRRANTPAALLTAFIPLILPFVLHEAAAQTPTPPRPYEGGITLELWTTEDRIIHGEETTPEQRLLREARYTLSGIIYGWEFSYVPGDQARRVAEWFELDPIAEVPWGSPGLSVRDLRALEGTLHGQIDYTFSRIERAHLSQWSSFTSSRGSGSGSGPLLDGLPGKIEAIEAAIHHAVREYLRSRYPNRPREVTGRVALLGPPRVRAAAGEYHARVTIAIEVREVLDYEVF